MQLISLTFIWYIVFLFLFPFLFLFRVTFEFIILWTFLFISLVIFLFASVFQFLFVFSFPFPFLFLFASTFLFQFIFLSLFTVTFPFPFPKWLNSSTFPHATFVQSTIYFVFLQSHQFIVSVSTIVFQIPCFFYPSLSVTWFYFIHLNSFTVDNIDYWTFEF